MKRPIVLFLFLYFISFSSIAQKDFDAKLEKLIQNDEFEKAKLHLKKTFFNSNENSTEKYIYYNAKAGFIYLRLGIIDSALYFSKNAIRKIEPTLKKEVKYEAWKSMAYSYCKVGKIDSATIFTQQLYEAVDKTNNFEMKRYANILMGIISFRNKLLNESLDYYVKALEQTKISKNNQNYKVDYYNLGLTHTMLKNFEEGIKFLKLAEINAINSNDKILLGRIYGTTADNYAAQGNDEKRQFFLEKANAVGKSIGDSKLIAMGESHQMQWNFHNGKINEAYKEGTKIVENLKKENLTLLETKSDSMMYVMAKKSNQPIKALYYLETFTKNKFKILEENGRDKLEEIRAKYELKNKNLIIQKQNLEIIASNRIHKIAFLIITLFIIIFSVIAFMYFKHKKNIHLIYKKEKEKDLQIKKLQDRINSYALIKNTNNITNKLDIISKNETDLVPKSQDLFEKIMMVLETEKLFLNPDLDQNTIIKIIGTNKKYLYEAVAQNSDLNFRGIINRLRINEAKSIIEQKILNKEEINFSNLFSESGFNSNSSFYRTFKTATGITPNDYAEEFRKDYIFNQ
jgi:AraC-like DNA-binding protein